MTTFNETFIPVFKRVCSALGDGWRFDQRRADELYRIFLFTPALPNYSIVVLQEKDRLILTGSPKRSRSYNDYSRCTVALTREPRAIAQDIRKKILAYAPQQIDKAAADLAGRMEQKEDRQILLNLLSRLIETRDLQNRNGILCELKAQCIRGYVSERYQGSYNLELSGLGKDQLIKLAGFISMLER